MLQIKRFVTIFKNNRVMVNFSNYKIISELMNLCKLTVTSVERLITESVKKTFSFTEWSEIVCYKSFAWMLTNMLKSKLSLF